jgi:hypothetical protein
MCFIDCNWLFKSLAGKGDTVNVDKIKLGDVVDMLDVLDMCDVLDAGDDGDTVVIRCVSNSDEDDIAK